MTFADFTEANEADIEDIFGADFYLDLVNAEFGTTILDSAMPQTSQRIITRLENHFENEPLPDSTSFNHYRPARYLSENTGSLNIPDHALNRFEIIFKALNQLLSP